MSTESRFLTAVTAVLLSFGLAVLYSASAIVAMQDGLGSAYYLQKQLTGLVAGVAVFMIVAKFDADRWSKFAWPIMWVALITMLVIVLPGTEGIARRVNGSRRFLFGNSFQPSEFAKFAVVVWTAMLVVKKGDGLRRLTKGLMPFLVVVGALDLFAALEPDLSVAMMLTLIMGVVLFAGGVRIGHFVALGVIAIPLVWREMERLQYVMLRMASFLDPHAAPVANYQLKQSLIAVGSGGWLGVGFGEGRQQYGFLPMPQTDFIGSNIGEEWGFAGLTFVTLLYVLYAVLGFRIARGARSPFLRLVAVGLTFTMAVTAFLHLGVVVGLLPTTGLTLPFISYGRSNLVLSLFMTGVLVNIGSEREKVFGVGASDPLK